MVGINKRPFPAAVRILGILTAVLVMLTGCVKGEENTSKDKESSENAVVYLGGEAVSAEEFEMLAKEYCNQIYMQYSTEEVNSEDFWETETDGTAPYEKLEDTILEDLKYHYALKKLAVELGVTEEYTYDELQASREEENASRADTSDAGEVYGLSSFNEASYYKYWYSNLETQVTNALIRERIDISEKECRAYYEENPNEFSYETGVTILYAEIPYEEENQEGVQETARQLEKAMQGTDSTEELAQAFDDVSIERLELNSLNTQSGMSEVYARRWAQASQMEEGEVYGPYEDNGALCIMKCISRTDGGTIDFESVKSQVERYLQVQEAQKLIAQEAENLEVKKGGTTAKEVILSAVAK